MIEELKSEFKKLEDIANLVSKGESFEIDLSKLLGYNDFHDGKRFELDGLGKMFTYLNSLKSKTCIYVWETDNSDNAREIYNEYCVRKSSEIFCEDFGERKTHAYGLKHYLESDTKSLYVGTRLAGYTKKWNLTNIEGRIIQHLGYYDKGSTHALQLRYWATKYKLKLTVYELPDLNKNYYRIIEKLFALHFKPLIGRH